MQAVSNIRTRPRRRRRTPFQVSVARLGAQVRRTRHIFSGMGGAMLFGVNYDSSLHEGDVIFSGTPECDADLEHDRNVCQQCGNTEYSTASEFHAKATRFYGAYISVLSRRQNATEQDRFFSMMMMAVLSLFLDYERTLALRFKNYHETLVERHARGEPEVKDTDPELESIRHLPERLSMRLERRRERMMRTFGGMARFQFTDEDLDQATEMFNRKARQWFNNNAV